MLETVVVPSAISSFNNAALFAPAFLWWALLAAPLFVAAYRCSDIVCARLGWGRENILGRVSIWVAGLTLVWVTLFGGNYAVLRDDLSVMPILTAVIVFLCALFVSSHLRKYPLPQPRWKFWIMAAGVCAMVGASDMHAWWGPLVQIGALVFGGMMGRVARAEMRPIAGITLICLTVVAAIFIQPEFFRFGQLGELTPMHLGAIMLFGVAAMATLAVFNVNARGKISRGVYVKLKWLMRVICALGGALFLLADALPIYIGFLGALLVSFAMSVWHMGRVSDALGHKLFAVMIGVFGVITTMPVITVMAILYWNAFPKIDFWREIKGLL